MSTDIIQDTEATTSPVSKFYNEAHNQIIASRSQFKGPIPPASEFKAYEETLPGSAERLLAMAEQNSLHQREIDKHKMLQEEKLINNEIQSINDQDKREFIIKLLGVGVVAGMLMASVILAVLGREEVAMTLGGSTLVLVTAIFISEKISGKGKNKKKNN